MLEQILKLVGQGTVPHAILFAGPEGSGKRAAADKLAEALLRGKITQHPDLHVYAPDSTGGMHSIESMRKLIDEVYMAPYSAPAKVFIIEQAEKMLATSSNALLKTLEEPALNCYILMLTETPEAILPTILSRARKFTFMRLEKFLVEKTEERDRLVHFLSTKFGYTDFMKAAAAFDEIEDTDKLLDEILFWFRDRHLLKNGASSEHLYFQAYKEELDACSLHLPSLESIFDKIEKVRFALQQHMKPRNALELFRSA